jgi:hypothetical protein
LKSHNYFPVQVVFLVGIFAAVSDLVFLPHSNIGISEGKIKDLLNKLHAGLVFYQIFERIFFSSKKELIRYQATKILLLAL